ncbi:hypothetical protein [Bradyrhizobium erythrophlei]|uniref:Uncharacterized protein n=1 Tax=Bradyrhizobium erythrophlei TaxID=1437360 RepID=A0A1M5NEQ9_9BRAD|nr:hypothetical protein [Bradyrhizobium erythrophlei]SHG87669.1 hypothetical protein SAMN05443248_2953 [Bradyrhizobium erythrophlei]
MTPVRTLTVIEGRPQRSFAKQCHKCSYRAAVPVNTMKRPGAESAERQIITRKFEALGWEIGKKDICPSCVRNANHPQKKETEVQNQQVKPEVAVASQEPRQPTRDERRIIFDKLNNVYVDERTGYSPGWTDKKVSVDLGVPQAWVEKIRDENFGSIGSNSAIDEAVARGQRFLDQAVEMLKIFDQKLVARDKLDLEIRELCKPIESLREERSKLDSMIRDLAKAVRP